MEPFVHLHNHTEYSPLDGLQKMDEMMLTAIELGQNSIAMTDHGTLAGIYQFAQAGKRHGVKAIAGIEAYLSIGSRHERNVIYGDAFEGEKERRYHHLTILAQNATGWRNLVLLNNDASLNFFHKPRMDFDSIEQYGDGLILGTGCLGGPVASELMMGNMEAAKAATERLLRCVKGDKDRLFVEVMNHGSDEELAVLPGLHEIATYFGLRVVATNDAHYTRTEQAEDHNLLLAIQTNSKLDDPTRFQFSGDRTSYFMRSMEQMRAAFDGTPIGLEALTNSQVIADMCDDDLAGMLPQAPPPGTYRLPRIAVPEKVSERFMPGEYGCANEQQRYLYELVMRGARRRHGAVIPSDVMQRITNELTVIFGFGVENYFLIVFEVINWCRKNGVPTGPGRGSGAGCEVAYCLDITGVPPLDYDLLFERFLDPTRVGMPDFDLDFPEASLGPILEHFQEVYGYDNVARIGTLGSKQAKGMIRDVGRLIEKIDTADKMAKMVLTKEGGGTYSLTQMLDPEVVPDSTFRDFVATNDDAREVLERALPLDGISANPGIHACGIVISDRPLTDLLPMRRNDKEPAQPWVTQWEAPDLEEMGFLKLDRLGLRNLDIIAATLAGIEAGTGEIVDISYGNLPLDGPKAEKAWAMLAQGRTTGVFQAESEGMTKLMMGIGMHNLDDVSTALALYRPGPMGDGMHTRLVARRQGREQVNYDYITSDPREQQVIAGVLDKTDGVICYQEQVMMLSGEVAGFGPGLRNKLRKAISKKKGDQFKAIKDAFMRGAVIETTAGGFIEGLTPEGDTTDASMAFSEQTAATLWRTFEASAAYLFNKSHSVAYGWITWITAYLKANYPDYYAAALLSVTDDAEKRLPMLHALRGEGVTVLGPDINEGQAVTAVTAPGVVRLGLAEIRDVKSNAAELVRIREEGGPFLSLRDLAERAFIIDEKTGKPKKITVTVLNGLIESGACDSLIGGEQTARAGMASVLRAMAQVDDIEIPMIEWPVWEKAQRERNRLGIVVSQHPVSVLGPQILTMTTQLNGEYGEPTKPIGLHRLKAGDRVWTVGLLQSFSERPLRSGKGHIATFVLEGTSASVGGVMFDGDLTNQRLYGLPHTGQIVAAFVTVRPRRAQDEDDDEPGGIELICRQMVVLDLLAHDPLTPAFEVKVPRRHERPIIPGDVVVRHDDPASRDESVAAGEAVLHMPTEDAIHVAAHPLPPVEIEWHDLRVTDSSKVATVDLPRDWSRLSRKMNAPGLGAGLSSAQMLEVGSNLRAWGKKKFAGIEGISDTFEDNLGTDPQGRPYRFVWAG